MNPTIKNLSTNLGLYLGAALALLTVSAYAIQLELFTKWWLGAFITTLIIIAGAFSIIKSKQALDNLISFKDAFTAYFVTILIALIIRAFAEWVLFNIVDAEAANTIKTLLIDSQVENMKNWNTPQETINTFVEKLENEENMYSIGNTLSSLIFRITTYSIGGLILALILKNTSKN